MNKSQLIKTLQDERAAWDALLTEVGTERMTTSGVVGDWSVKDLIAHIAAWEQRPVEWLAAARRGSKPTPAPWPPSLSGDDEVNAWIRNANHGRELAEVLAESKQVHEDLLRALESTLEEELNDPKRFAWLNGNALSDSIPGNSFEHYQHHANDIRAWLKLERA